MRVSDKDTNCTKIFLLSGILFVLLTQNISAQKKEKAKSEPGEYGNTLNIGLGMGYTGGVPLLLNYEFDVADNFTIAPFISYYSYNKYSYWGGPGYAYKKYGYHVTYIPIGAKGTYYFDQLLKAGDKWDFYAAASLGFGYSKIKWESGYYGTDQIRGTSPLFLLVHIGAEFHFNERTGMFLDLSSGSSSVGVSFKIR